MRKEIKKFADSEMDVRKKRDEGFKRDKDKAIVVNNKLMKALMTERENVFIQLKESNTAFAFEEIELKNIFANKKENIEAIEKY